MSWVCWRRSKRRGGSRRVVGKVMDQVLISSIGRDRGNDGWSWHIRLIGGRKVIWLTMYLNPINYHVISRGRDSWYGYNTGINRSSRCRSVRRCGVG